MCSILENNLTFLANKKLCSYLLSETVCLLYMCAVIKILVNVFMYSLIDIALSD